PRPAAGARPGRARPGRRVRLGVAGGRARGRVGREAGPLELAVELQLAGDLRDVPGLLGADERDADPGAPGAARAPDAVDVALAVVGRIELDHVRDAVDVVAAR